MPPETTEATQAAQRIDNSTLFQALSTPYIVFGVDDPDFTILEENKLHARIAMVDREHILGRPLLEVFPDTSEEYIESGVSRLIESIRKVIRTGEPDSMPDLSYDLKDKSGTFRTKFWSVTHHPLKGKSGKVIAVFQETKDITEEVVMGKELERTQHQLDQILGSSLIGTYIWYVAEDSVYADTNLINMFGLRSDEADAGLSIEKFFGSIHEDDRLRVKHEVYRAVKNNNSFEAEYRTYSNKQLRWVIARGHTDTDENGAVVSMSGVVIDITDRKQIEQALTESESQRRFIADAMPQLAWSARPDGYREDFNQQWYDYTGTKPGNAEGSKWIELVHPADREKTWKAWRHAMKNGDLYEHEYRLYHAPSKTYRWVIGRGLPFRNDQQEVIRWYGTSTDIDEQKRNAQVQTFLGNVSKELTTSLNYKQMLRKITRLCIPAVADWCSIDLYDPETGFTQVSVAHRDPKKVSEARAFREHNPPTLDQPTGVPAVLRTGKSEYYPFISDEMLEQSVDDPKLLRFMKSLQLKSMIIAPIRSRDKVIGGITFVSSESGRYYTDRDRLLLEELGDRISLALTNSQLYEESQQELQQRHKLERELRLEKQKLESRVKERTQQLQLTNEGLRAEIIKRHEIERELQAYSEDLARSNRELEDFAYVASHDLQEPLRKIQAFSNLLSSEYAEQLGEGADYVERMNAAAARMSTLIQDLLAFSRVTTKTNPAIDVDLKSVVADVLVDLEARVEDVGGTVVVGDLPRVVADPTHMRQLFQNLIGNALKFHRPDDAPMVEVSARRHGGACEIRVKDNGIGFDEKYLDKIFSVFQRLHGRDSYEGTGIGLAVCRKIVERYGGTITAESEKNKGATFIVRLPHAKENRK